MIVDGRTYLDNTLARSAHACSLQMVLRHVLHWNSRDATSYLRAGTAAHEAYAYWNTLICEGHAYDSAREGANAVFAGAYQPYSNEWVGADDRMHYENLATILDEWFTTRAGKLPWVVPDKRLIEVGFAYPLDDAGRVIAYGRMDEIGRDRHDGAWVPVDLKTTGRIDQAWTDQWTLDPQITHYTWAALQHVPHMRGFYINGIEFSRLPQSDRKCPTHGLKYHECGRAHLRAEVVGPIDRTPALLDRWRADALRAAEKYTFYARAYDPANVGTTPDLSNVECEGPFVGACRFCTFKDWCRLGQRAEMLPAMFVQDEWHPYDPRAFEGASPADEVLNP